MCEGVKPADEGCSSHYLAPGWSSCHFCIPVYRRLGTEVAPRKFGIHRSLPYSEWLGTDEVFKRFGTQRISWVGYRCLFLIYDPQNLHDFCRSFWQKPSAVPNISRLSRNPWFHFCKTPYLCPTGKDPWIQFSKIQAPVPNRALPGDKNTFFAKYLLTIQQAVCYSPTR